MWWHDVKDIKECMVSLADRLARIEEYFQETEDLFRLQDLENSTDSLAEKTLDKFEDYMKNMDKLNGMINELKGCSSMARGALVARKEIDEQLIAAMKAIVSDVEDHASKTSKKINSMSKLMRKIAEKLQVCEKKSRKKAKRVKIDPDFPAA